MVMLKRSAPKNDPENRWNFGKWTNGDPKSNRKLLELLHSQIVPPEDFPLQTYTTHTRTQIAPWSVRPCPALPCLFVVCCYLRVCLFVPQRQNIFVRACRNCPLDPNLGASSGPNTITGPLLGGLLLPSLHACHLAPVDGRDKAREA